RTQTQLTQTLPLPKPSPLSSDLIVGGVEPSSRPDLYVGARRGRLFPALRQNFPSDATSRSDHRDRPPGDLKGRRPRSLTSGTANQATSPRGHDLNNCPTATYEALREHEHIALLQHLGEETVVGVGCDEAD
ncbi:unnamed protein product, partial [Musa acuminata var. zebrina]